MVMIFPLLMQCSIITVAAVSLLFLATLATAQNHSYESLTARIPDHPTRIEVENLLARRGDLSKFEIDEKYDQIRRMYEPFIAGGKEAAPGAWPWAAAIAMATVDGPPLPFCGGTLIADNWVLTAAHCKVCTNNYIILGRTDLKANTGEVRLAAGDHIPHPVADIAVVRLNRASSLSTVELNTDDSIGTLSNPEATVIGWGQLVTGGPSSPRLQQVSFPIVSLADCRRLYAGISLTISDTMLCAGQLNRAMDTCRGDSGGPLLVRGRNGNGWRQAGVVGSGAKKCDEKMRLAGIYVRVAPFTAWIREMIMPNKR